jgi:hypothetical protein
LALEHGQDYELRVVRCDRQPPQEVQVIEHYRPGRSVNLVDIEFPA